MAFEHTSRGRSIEQASVGLGRSDGSHLDAYRFGQELSERHPKNIKASFSENSVLHFTDPYSAPGGHRETSSPHLARGRGSHEWLHGGDHYDGRGDRKSEHREKRDGHYRYHLKEDHHRHWKEQHHYRLKGHHHLNWNEQHRRPLHERHLKHWDGHHKLDAESERRGSADKSGHFEHLAAEALKLAGLPINKANLRGVHALVAREDNEFLHGGGSCRANTWDQNFRDGNASVGPAQVTPTTFYSFHAPGHANICDPIDNIAAGLKYAKATGRISRAFYGKNY
jgi:hypothetical protein